MVKLTQILPDFPFFHQSAVENQLFKFNVQRWLRGAGQKPAFLSETLPGWDQAARC
jgi:hypothetical protein